MDPVRFAIGSKLQTDKNKTTRYAKFNSQLHEFGAPMKQGFFTDILSSKVNIYRVSELSQLLKISYP